MFHLLKVCQNPPIAAIVPTRPPNTPNTTATPADLRCIGLGFAVSNKAERKF